MPWNHALGFIQTVTRLSLPSQLGCPSRMLAVLTPPLFPKQKHGQQHQAWKQPLSTPKASSASQTRVLEAEEALIVPYPATLLAVRAQDGDVRSLAASEIVGHGSDLKSNFPCNICLKIPDSVSASTKRKREKCIHHSNKT